MPFDFAPDARQSTGYANYHDGLAAEDAVANRYLGRGAKVLCRRWKGPGGEVDIVAQDGDCVVFIEVKKARTIGDALHRLSARQMSRICASAESYVATLPDAGLTNIRIDFAVVDANGEIDVLENVSIF